MKGKLIEKWKQEGVKEFIMNTLRHQIARRTLEESGDFNLKVSKEMLPFIFQTSIKCTDVGSSTFMGHGLEVY